MPRTPTWTCGHGHSQAGRGTRPRSPHQVGGASSWLGPAVRARRNVGVMTGGSDAHPTLAQEAGTAVTAAVLRLAYLTGAQIVQAPPWPGASLTEEQPEPGAGIRIALALERAARAGVRVYIRRASEAGMSWAQVRGAPGVAELAQERAAARPRRRESTRPGGRASP